MAPLLKTSLPHAGRGSRPNAGLARFLRCVLLMQGQVQSDSPHVFRTESSAEPSSNKKSMMAFRTAQYTKISIEGNEISFLWKYCESTVNCITTVISFVRIEILLLFRRTCEPRPSLPPNSFLPPPPPLPSPHPVQNCHISPPSPAAYWTKHVI